MPASLAHQQRMLAHLQQQAATPSPLDLAWERINALGGYVGPGDAAGKAANDAIGEALKVIESLGGADPLRKRAPASNRLLILSGAITRAQQALNAGRIGNSKHILADMRGLMDRELGERT